MKDVVIGIDSSTTATKAIAWDNTGTPLAEGRSSLSLQNPRPDWLEQDPNDWWTSTCDALQQLWQHVNANRVAALAISNQRETVAALDSHGKPVRPAILWLDGRCANEVGWLSEQLGAATLHTITGRPPDMTTAVYSLAWMLRHEPENYHQTARFVEVHGYLVQKLTGDAKTSWASADPLGVFDIHSHSYAEPILDFLQLTEHQFMPAYATTTPLGQVTKAAADATGLAEGTLVAAGGGDGQAAGLGLSATFPERAYLNLGTAVVSGIYSATAAIDNACRTLVACGEAGYILETCLRSGTFLLTWFTETFLDDPTNVNWQALEDAAAKVPIGSEGLLLLPHWSGSMTPHWDVRAKGAMIGLGSSHKRPEIYRAVLEGIALEQAAMTADVERLSGTPLHELVLTGGGANNSLWCQMLADVLAKPLYLSRTTEASNLGAAIAAAVAAGWYKDTATAASEMTALGECFEPQPESQTRYQELFGIYEQMYASVRDINHQLIMFRQ
ncbi:MAG: FGGY family carbohydrate kinase [Deinococcota bacterium]